MTTLDEYRLLVPIVGASASERGPNVRLFYGSLGDVLIRPIRTDEMLAHARVMHELAALSINPDSLERGLEDEINRNAWGISDA